MFESLEIQKKGPRRKRWIAFIVTSGVVNALLVVGAAILISMREPLSDDEAIPIFFAERPPTAPLDKPAVSPPPAPQPTPKPRETSSRGRRLRGALEAPTKMPTTAPLDVDPERPADSVEHAAAGPDTTVGHSTTAEPVDPQTARTQGRKAPIASTEVTSPAVPDPNNPEPAYPESARKAGLEGLVDLKVEITEEGDVIPIRALQGEETFVSAVQEVVRQWKFRPATLEGKTVAVYRVLRFRFRLQD